jgi:hypothetical protein
MKLWVFTLILVCLIAGCVTPQAPEHSFAVNTADFTTATDLNLCTVYGYGWSRAQEAKDELVKRNVFTASQWPSIEHQKIEPGMSLCAVFAAFANSCAKYTNTKDPKGNDVKVLIYTCSEGRAPLCPYTEVIIKNDKVIEIKQIESWE